ncbi:hypothetical protein ACQ86G_20785 [Roseateles chitinivorans]
MEALKLCDIDAPQLLTTTHNCGDFHQGWRLSPVDPMLLMVPL